MPDLSSDMREIITAPGCYDIPTARYHEDPCPEPSLSCSIAKILLNASPLHAAAKHPRLAKHPIRTDKAIFDLGKAAHKLLLGKGEPLVIVKADSWRTKAAREARDAARLAGKTPLLQHQFENTVRMAEACRAQLAEHMEGDLLASGKGEQALIWREGDVWCRSLIDWMPEVIEEGAVFIDYKSTAASAHPSLWAMRTGAAIGFDFQRAFYGRGISQVFKVKNFRFIFIVQENFAPYTISIIEIDAPTVRAAMRHVKTAVGIWRSCLRSNSWPGYPDETIRVAPPSRITRDPHTLLEDG